MHVKKRIWNKKILQYIPENKQRLKEYQKNYRKAKVSTQTFFVFFFLYKSKKGTKSLDFW